MQLTFRIRLQKITREGNSVRSFAVPVLQSSSLLNKPTTALAPATLFVNSACKHHPLSLNLLIAKNADKAWFIHLVRERLAQRATSFATSEQSSGFVKTKAAEQLSAKDASHLLTLLLNPDVFRQPHHHRHPFLLHHRAHPILFRVSQRPCSPLEGLSPNGLYKKLLLARSFFPPAPH